MNNKPHTKSPPRLAYEYAIVAVSVSAVMFLAGVDDRGVQ